MYYLLLFFPMLSMNLALFNILPVPSLDGARAVFVLIEMIFRKPVNRKVEGYIHTIGLFLLLGMVIFFDIYHFAVAARLLI
jgi:regulator of sigma E protease